MRHKTGFSLIELVAVLAIFALVSLIGVQVIQATLRSSERLSEISEETQQLALGLAILRQDLNAALPRTFTPPDGGTEPALVMSNTGFSLTRGGLGRLEPFATGFGRVTWRLDRARNVLTREVWTTLTPGPGSPAITTVLQDIDTLELSSFSVEGGWRPGFSADPRFIERLPLAVRVRFSHRKHEQLETLVSWR